jgi:hypothetical protein
MSFPLALCLVAGCGGTPAPVNQDGGAKKGEDDPLQEAREVARQAAEPRGYQPALELVNGHLSAQKDALAPYQVGPKDRPALLKALGKRAGADADKMDAQALERRLLGERVGLDEDELREVEAARFSPLDAHYLDFCFLLRDAVRSLRQGERAGGAGAGRDLTRLEQVRLAFDWAMRQVALETRSPDLQPPEFALRLGHGGPRERALVFLALLRQMDFDGCVIAYPGKGGPVYWLAGVLLTDKDAGNVYLFDPRLGLPVPGPDGGVATLAQLRKQPDLLKRLNAGAPYDYDVTPAEAAKAEVHVVLPLSALSARMRFLEDEVFAAHDRVNLALRPDRVLEQFEAAGVGEVHVWNRRGEKAGPRPLTPTRVLRESLPPQEGGVDARGVRYARYRESRIPWFPVAQGLREMKIDEDLPIAVGPLREFVSELFQLYVLTPHQQIIRGRFEDASKRLVRLEKALGEFEAAQADAAAFAQQLARWRKLIQAAFQQGKGQRVMEAMMEEDPWFQAVRAAEEPQVERQKLRKGMLGVIIFRAAGEVLGKEVLYLQALCWQEKAERTQARLVRAAPGKGPAGGAAQAAAKNAAKDAWDNAVAIWAPYEGAKATPALIAGRVQEAVSARGALNVEATTSALDQLIRDLRRSLTAQSLRARALRAVGRDREAAAALQGLLTEAELVMTSKELQGVRGDLLRTVPEQARELFETVLFGDLRPGGSFHWIAYRARLELRQHAGK